MRPPYSQHERPARKGPLDPILTELEGYTGLGMKREALRLIRRILRQPKVTAVQFEEAVGTLLTTENRLKRWRKHVEAGYARLSARGQRRARFWMLSFFHSAHDYTSASRFIPERFRSPYGMIELAFAWDIWGALENEQALARHFDQMTDWAERAEDPFMRGNLFASLGDYCLHRAWWRRAVECYKEIPVESANAHQAVLGPLLVIAGELLSTCGDVKETLGEFQLHHEPDVGSSLSNEMSAEYRTVGRQLSALESGLRRLLGKTRLKELVV